MSLAERKWQDIRTWSLSLSWWPMMAVAWCGYFCFRCSRKASLFRSISDVCIPRISLELRGPPRVCLLGMLREDLEADTRLFPLERRSLVLRHSASSKDVTWRLLFPCSESISFFFLFFGVLISFFYVNWYFYRRHAIWKTLLCFLCHYSFYSFLPISLNVFPFTSFAASHSLNACFPQNSLNSILCFFVDFS